jgi:hypothetical protein
MRQRIVPLPGNIWLTSKVLVAIREGYRAVSSIPDPVASIEFAIPLESSKPGFWALSWFSKQDLSTQVLFKLEDLELVLSSDAQARLSGKVIDLVNGKVVTRDYSSTELRDT